MDATEFTSRSCDKSDQSDKRSPRALTQRTVEAEKPVPGKRVQLWCGQIRGFGCIVHESGRKSWVVRYITKSGTDRREKLGGFPALSIAQARALAQARLAAVAQGADPLAEKREARQEAQRSSFTVASAFRLYIDHMSDKAKAERPWRERTKYEVERLLSKEIEPVAFGQLILERVTEADVRVFRESFIRRERPAPILANRVLAWLRHMFEHARAQVWLPSESRNPVDGIKRFRETKRTRTLSDPELADLGRAMRETAAQGTAEAAVVDALTFCALTGLRKANCLGLRWSEIRERESMLSLRETKTSAVERPYGSAVRALLARRKAIRAEGAVYVFAHPTKGGACFAQAQRVVNAVMARAGLDGAGAWHVHRHGYATTLGKLRYPLSVGAALLGHAIQSQTADYQHLGAEDPLLAEAAERAESRIQAALDGKALAVVVPFAPTSTSVREAGLA